MKKLFTIGHTKKSLKRFVELLREAQVDAVVDIRLHNTSQLAGYSKTDDLQFVLEELLGIRYLHVTELAPNEELLKQYRKDKSWEAYHERFRALMAERDAVKAALPELSAFERPCLLCSEHKPDRCHRKIAADLMAAELPDVEVTHLL